MNHHDENGPSQLEKRMGCPGSRAAEAGMQDDDDEHSTRGDALHAVVAAILKSKTEPERLALLGQVKGEDLPAVEACLAEADAVRAKAHEVAGPDDTVLELVEYHVDLREMGIHKGGTIDFAIVIPGRCAWLRDWKFGARIARWPKNNPQLMAYAVGLWTALGAPNCNAGILQPALGDDQSPTHTWEGDDFARMQDEIGRAVARTFAPDAPLIPGPHCQNCRRKPTCDARCEMAGTVAVLRDPVAVMRATDPKDRASLWERLNVAIRTLEGAAEAIKDEALAGTLEIPGYVREEGLKDREWVDPAVAEQAMLRLASAKGLPAEVVAPRKLLTPGGADKVFGKGKAVVNALAGLTKRDKGSPKLVRSAPVITN